MIDEITSELVKMIIQMNSMHNDGFTRELYHKKLVEYRELIDKGLKDYKS